MEQSILDALKHHEDQYLLPFFWQHGEDPHLLLEEMAKIADCGAGAVCLEARPHPDFAGPGWWHDLDIILADAKARNMKVWILDDAHFPTGFANGLLAQKPDEMRKQYIQTNLVDVAGPLSQAVLAVADMARTVPMPAMGQPSLFAPKNQKVFYDDQLLSVTACRITEGDRIDSESLTDLTPRVVDGSLIWDVPPGMWRVFVTYLTRNGGGNTEYINMLDSQSVGVLLEAVYEPHYQRCGKYFGNTIAGFFSDEPCFGNTIGFQFDESIGRKRMPLPWSREMSVLLAERLGADWTAWLPLLWFDSLKTQKTDAFVRYTYMDIATRLVADNFSRQLGQWCQQHGVEYIGHVIEDNNQHSRLGSSLGHFYRSMAGQHMAGIDCIGNQVIPGQPDNTRYGFATNDGEFFHFALGKLGSSLGHIDPLKKGRTVCEIFGAYGWSLGVRDMKWLIDHFVVRGVNHFVPHAFSAKDFPDPDCPPHFYARGNNPQYRHFSQLMRYTSRLCHVFNQGKSMASAAILYHGESEWTGQTQFVQKPARVLTENQIDFDIVPSDVFAEPGALSARLDGACMIINEICYRALIIPAVQYVTGAVARFIKQAELNQFPVLFIDQRPQDICDCIRTEPQLLDTLRQCGEVVALPSLADRLRELGLYEIELSRPFPELRFMHYRKQDDLFMFFNESLHQVVDQWITLPSAGQVSVYDAWQNTLAALPSRTVMDGSGQARTKIHLRIEPWQSCVVQLNQQHRTDELTGLAPARQVVSSLKPVQSIWGRWRRSFADALNYPRFSDEEAVEGLVNIARERPEFSGTIAYSNELVLEREPDTETELVLESAFEAVEVWVNQQSAGMIICPPYRLKIGMLLHSGSNTIRIEVTNTCANQVKAMPDQRFSFFNKTKFEQPVGLLGQVSLMEPDLVLE